MHSAQSLTKPAPGSWNRSGFGTACLGRAMRALAWLGAVWQGLAGLGTWNRWARHGVAAQGTGLGKAWRGKAWRGAELGETPERDRGINSQSTTTMKIRYKIDQAHCFRLGINCPKSVAEIEVDPATLPQDQRNMIADRLNGINVVSAKTGDLIVAATPGFDSLIWALLSDSGAK